MKQFRDVNHINKKELATLNVFLKEIIKHSSFYQNKYSQVLKKVSQGKLTNKDFLGLPLLEKDELVKDQVLNPPYGTNLTQPQEDYLFIKSTSGSSGKPPLKIPSTKADRDKRAIVFGDGYRQLLKIKRPDRLLNYMPSNTSFYQVKTMEHIGYDVFSVEEHVDPKEIIDRICFHKIKSMETITTKLFALMKYVRDNDIDPKTIPLKKVVTIGEGYLSNSTARKLLKKYLNAECYEGVGSTECGSFAKECVLHNGSHFINNSSIYEVINPKTSKHDTKGELVITTLWCKGFPLIRYRTGDYVEIDSSPCKCGYPSSRMKMGSVRRYSDNFTVNRKTFTSVQFDELVRKFIGVNNYFVKIRADRMIIEVERETVTKDSVSKITRFFQNKFDFPVSVRLIENADKTLSGTWKFNRIYDARKGPQYSLFVRGLAKMNNILRTYLNKKTILYSKDK